MVHISSELVQAESFHPKIATYIQFDADNELNSSPDCHLDLVYELPPSVFVDPYQLRDLTTTIGTATVFGEHDLELPLEKIKEKQGSLVFLRQHKVNRTMHVELPLHLRYQQPSASRESQPITIEAPYAGWTCDNSQHIAYSKSLKEKYSLLKDQFTAEADATTAASFTELADPTSLVPLTLYVPVGKKQASFIVTLGTFLTVLLCTGWILRTMVASLHRRKRREAKGKRRCSE